MINSRFLHKQSIFFRVSVKEDFEVLVAITPVLSQSALKATVYPDCAATAKASRPLMTFSLVPSKAGQEFE